MFNWMAVNRPGGFAVFLLLIGDLKKLDMVIIVMDSSKRNKKSLDLNMIWRYLKYRHILEMK